MQNDLRQQNGPCNHLEEFEFEDYSEQNDKDQNGNDERPHNLKMGNCFTVYSPNLSRFSRCLGAFLCNVQANQDWNNQSKKRANNSAVWDSHGDIVIDGLNQFGAKQSHPKRHHH